MGPGPGPPRRITPPVGGVPGPGKQSSGNRNLNIVQVTGTGSARAGFRNYVPENSSEKVCNASFNKLSASDVKVLVD